MLLLVLLLLEPHLLLLCVDIIIRLGVVGVWHLLTVWGELRLAPMLHTHELRQHIGL